MAHIINYTHSSIEFEVVFFWIQLLSYLIIFLLLWWLYYKKEGKPSRGLLFGLFLVLVFGVRFLIEFIKEPQEGFEKSMTLNMGQLLSIPLIITGAILVYLAIKKSTKMG